MRSRSFAAGWPTVESFSSERHDTALDYNGDPVIYLVAEFADQSFRALIKPGEKKLFEDMFGFLISYGAWPQLPRNAPPTIFATRASQVHDAFRATDARRRTRLRPGGDSGYTRAFCEDVESFLVCTGECQDRRQLWDTDAECSKKHELLGHRVYLHGETHRWTIDAEMDLALWNWVAHRGRSAHRTEGEQAGRQEERPLQDDMAILSELADEQAGRQEEHKLQKL